jgi:hypothetical protein
LDKRRRELIKFPEQKIKRENKRIILEDTEGR